MEKKNYIAPEMEVVEADCRESLLLSLSSDEVGYGGSARDQSVDEADVSENNNWDVW